jgi:PPIC-type PPIASE domain
MLSLRKQYLSDEAALKQYYDARRTFFDQPRVRLILVRFKGSSVPLRPGLRDLSREEARAKAVELHAKLAAGGDFAALAKSESDDIGSRPVGGDLGFCYAGRNRR